MTKKERLKAQRGRLAKYEGGIIQLRENDLQTNEQVRWMYAIRQLSAAAVCVNEAVMSVSRDDVRDGGKDEMDALFLIQESLRCSGSCVYSTAKIIQQRLEREAK